MDNEEKYKILLNLNRIAAIIQLFNAGSQFWLASNGKYKWKFPLTRECVPPLDNSIGTLFEEPNNNIINRKPVFFFCFMWFRLRW